MGSIPIGSSSKIYGENMENKESFDELYNKLYAENFSELEVLRKEDEKGVKKILKIIGIIFLFFIFFGILFVAGFINAFSSGGSIGSMMLVALTVIIGMPLLIIITIVLVSVIIKTSKTSSVVEKRGIAFEPQEKDKKTYKNIFKEKIVSKLINLGLENSEYYHDVGLTEEEYNLGEWEKYDIYDSEDKIVATVNNEKMVIAEVRTEDIRRDSDGDTKHVTLFHGLAGYIDLPKDIGCYIKVVKDRIKIFGRAEDDIKMDMSEFEKIFDVKTDNKIKAMQILTVDIMTEIIELIKTTKVKFEFYINHNKMYVRFHTGEVFEPDVFGQAMKYEEIKKYFDIIYGVRNITGHICNVISNTEL